MKRTLATLAMTLLVIVCMASDNGLLWKVTGNGLSRPTYILGSHHLAPASMIDSISGLREAIAAADVIYGEVAADELTSMTSKQKMMVNAMAPADSTLSKLFTAEQLDAVDAVLAKFFGSRGMIAQMEMLKPTMISTQIAMLQSMAEYPQFQTATPFDATVMALGQNDGKPVRGLETIDKQIQVIFGEPLSVQAEDLMDMIDNYDRSVEQLHLVTDSFLAQDLDGVTKAMLDAKYATSEARLDRLIFNRNNDWAEQLDSLMHDKGLFVVVGCGHLGSDKGLLNLLKQKGYDVQPVK